LFSFLALFILLALSFGLLGIDRSKQAALWAYEQEHIHGLQRPSIMPTWHVVLIPRHVPFPFCDPPHAPAAVPSVCPWMAWCMGGVQWDVYRYSV
jgi:hypothetical protein